MGIVGRTVSKINLVHMGKSEKPASLKNLARKTIDIYICDLHLCVFPSARQLWRVLFRGLIITLE